MTRESQGLRGPEYERDMAEFDRKWMNRDLTAEERKQAQAEYVALLDKHMGMTEQDYEAIGDDDDLSLR